ALGFALAEADAGKRRVGEHAVGDQPVARAAITAREVVAEDPEVVDRHMGGMRAAGAFADRPDTGRRWFQPLVDLDVSARIEGDAGLVEADAAGVRDATGRDEDVAAFDLLLAAGRVHREIDLFAGAAAHGKGLGRCQKLNAIFAEDPLHLLRD